MYTIYRMHCEVNNKSYIGITDSFKRRMNVHRTCFTETVLSRTIQKYGWETFTVYKIDRAKTWEEACDKERFYITSLNTKAPVGMNMTNGGEGVFGLKHSDRTRKKMSESHKGKNLGPDNPMFGKVGPNKGKKFSKETRKKMSESCKDRIPWNRGKKCPQLAGKNNGFYGKTFSEDALQKISRQGKQHSEETKQKMSASRKVHTGWHHSEQAKLNMSIAARNRKSQGGI